MLSRLHDSKRVRLTELIGCVLGGDGAAQVASHPSRAAKDCR